MVKKGLRTFIFMFSLVLLAFLPACRDASRPTKKAGGGDAGVPTGPSGTGIPDFSVLGGQSQALAMLPGAAQDLDKLSGLPHYRIQVEIEPQALKYKGHMVLEYTNLEGVELDHLYLRLYPNGGESYGNGEITVSSLSLEDQPVEYQLSLSDSVLEVRLPESLPPGAQVSLSLDFSAHVPADFGGESSAAYGIFNYTEDVLALSGWYPILAVYDQDGWNLDPVTAVGDAVYSDMAYYSVQVVLPADQVLAATGSEVDRLEAGSQNVITLVSGPARDFFLVSSPTFTSASQQVGGVAVNMLTMGDLPEARQFMLEVAVESLEIFNQAFGAYPYRELDIVQAPMRNAGGVEYPGIVLIEAGRSQEPQNPVLATTVAHEVAHQWWYNLVGNDVFEEPWLDEALTTFSSMLYWEEVFGPKAYGEVQADFQSRYDKAIENEVQGEIDDGIDFYLQPENTPGYGAFVYFKGALFFAALRQEIGDEAFFSALQHYYQDQQYGIASGVDLLSAFETAAGRSLEAFFRDWLDVEPLESR